MNPYFLIIQLYYIIAFFNIKFMLKKFTNMLLLCHLRIIYSKIFNLYSKSHINCEILRQSFTVLFTKFWFTLNVHITNPISLIFAYCTNMGALLNLIPSDYCRKTTRELPNQSIIYELVSLKSWWRYCSFFCYIAEIWK